MYIRILKKSVQRYTFFVAWQNKSGRNCTFTHSLCTLFVFCATLPRRFSLPSPFLSACLLTCFRKEHTQKKEGCRVKTRRQPVVVGKQSRWLCEGNLTKKNNYSIGIVQRIHWFCSTIPLISFSDFNGIVA